MGRIKSWPGDITPDVLSILDHLETVQAALLVMRREGIDGKNIGIIAELFPLIEKTIQSIEDVNNRLGDEYVSKIGQPPKWGQVLMALSNQIDDIMYYLDCCQTEYRDKNWRGVDMLLKAMADTITEIEMAIKSVPFGKKTTNAPVTLKEAFRLPVDEERGR